jgi:2-methylisocitrate lyase-like PEP mutase family enzyme
MTSARRGPREVFKHLHATGSFVIPNAWDVGSARILESLGFPAVATTSSGFAATLGRLDQNTSLEELEAHVAAMTASLEVPVSVDAENCFSPSVDGIEETVERLAAAGASALSIEDYDPVEAGLYPIDAAIDRVAAAAGAAHANGMLLTGRAENHLYGVDDVEDTLRRLTGYRDAGADVLYAPGLDDEGKIHELVALGRPINVLLRPNGPDVRQLSELGVRRMSTGGALANAAYGILAAAGRELLESGTSTYAAGSLSHDDRRRAFGVRSG